MLFRLVNKVLLSIPLYHSRVVWPTQQDPRCPVCIFPWQKHATATLHIKTLERCSPKIPSKHVSTVCHFHPLQAGPRFQIMLFQNCCLLTTSLCYPMSMASCRPSATGSELMPTENLWRWTHTNLRWCASTPGLITACLLFIMMAHNYYTPTHSNTWAWCVTKISDNCGGWSAETLLGWHNQSKKVCTKKCPYQHRLHAHIWLLKIYAIPASMYAKPVLVNPFLKTGQRYGQPSSEVAFESVKKNPWGQGHYSSLVRYARVWPWAPTVQLVSCHNAFLQSSGPMQQHYLSCQTSFTCWHATEQ